MFKVALIGIGGMGKCHFNCYKKIESVQVVAVCDVRADMAKEKIEGANIPVYEDYDQLLAEVNPDYVDICTPSYLHSEMSIKALEKGIHVLCEKPMALSSKDTAAVIEAANKSGKVFMTAHVVRFMTPYMYLKSVIESKELGKLLRLDMKRISHIPTWSFENWMCDTRKSGGSPFDMSVHDIDFTQYVLGEPNEVRGVYHKMKDSNDYIVSELIYDDCIVTCEAAWYDYELPFNASFNAVFTNGTLKCEGGKIFKNGEEIDVESSLDEKMEDTGINISGVDGYGRELRYFLSCIEKNEKAQMVTPESSQASIKLVERILANSIII